MAILSALLTTALLTTLALTLALLGLEEAMLASHDRSARALQQASMAAINLAVADLRAASEWDLALSAGAQAEISGAPGRLTDTTLSPPSPWDGVPIDLRAQTARLQAIADAERRPGDGPQIWRLLIYGRFDRAAPGASAGPWYIAVWVADDRADTDGDPLRDTNRAVALRAVAFGPADGIAASGAVAARRTTSEGSDEVSLLTVRPAS